MKKKYVYLFGVIGLIIGLILSPMFLNLEDNSNIEEPIEHSKLSDVFFVILCTMLITFSFVGIGIILDIELQKDVEK